jgi:hypothetical protein
VSTDIKINYEAINIIFALPGLPSFIELVGVFLMLQVLAVLLNNTQFFDFFVDKYFLCECLQG